MVEVCSEMFGILAILYWTGWGVPHLPDHVVAGRSLPNMARATCSKVINLIIKTVISNISSAAASSFPKYQHRQPYDLVRVHNEVSSEGVAGPRLVHALQLGD